MAAKNLRSVSNN